MELFPDYEDLQKHLDNMADRLKGRQPRHDTSKNVNSSTNEKPMTDEPMKPLSYSNTNDL